MVRNIMIITGSRGEYGYIKPIIEKIKDDNLLDYTIVATNMLLLPEFGYAVNNFLKDDIEVKYKIDMAMAGYSNTSMVKSLGVFLVSLTDIVNNDRPSMILLAGDRGEQIVGAIVGAHLNIPVAHIQAGELSGNIDGMSRHAITKYAHIHFASNLDAEERLHKMGEQAFRVFNTGAPQLDDFQTYKYLEKKAFFYKYNLDIERGYVLVVQHSITEESGASETQMNITLQALRELNVQAIIIYPNNDAGSAGVQEAIYNNKMTDFHIERNVGRSDYANMLKHADFIIGNSSSGILEAPTFKLPCINIGRRQTGRVQADNVINVEFNKKEIMEAIHKIYNEEEYLEKLKYVENPYGDGNSSQRICDILKSIEIDAKLINKELVY